jgi:hypothetical protein
MFGSHRLDPDTPIALPDANIRTFVALGQSQLGAFANLLVVPIQHGEREVHFPKSRVWIDRKCLAKICIRIGLNPHLFRGIADFTPSMLTLAAAFRFFER